MATGDAAAAKGLRVVPASQDLKQGYDAINERGDELAAEMDTRAAADNLRLKKTGFRVTETAMTSETATVGDVRVW